MNEQQMIQALPAPLVTKLTFLADTARLAVRCYEEAVELERGKEVVGVARLMMSADVRRLWEGVQRHDVLEART